MFFDDENKKYIILDIEGNSASKEEERRMTQFSAIVIKGDLHQEINMMNRNVNYISPFVQHLTKISIRKCKRQGLSERHMVEEIHHLLESADVIYAYGFDFDQRILQFMFKKYKLSKINKPWIDVQEVVKEKLSPTRLSLSIAAKEYGFEGTQFHNALVDCYATLHLMEYIDHLDEEVNV